MHIQLKHNFSYSIPGPYGSVVRYQDFEGWIDGEAIFDNVRVCIKNKDGNILFSGSRSLFDMMVAKEYINLTPINPWES